MIGESIRALRVRRALSQQDLAREAGINVTTVFRLESGLTAQARPVTIRRLAEALGVSPEVLTSFQVPLLLEPHHPKEGD